MHERGPDGVFAVHGYPISAAVSTFIVETDEASWRRAGLDEFDTGQPPGASDLASKDYLEKLFAEQIEGHRLLVNNSRWANFRTRRTRRWHVVAPRPVVLLGDAVHTAHFSVGSGTKMAMEDAVALARALAEHPATSSRPGRIREAAQPPVRQDSGLGPAKPGLVGALRQLPRRVRALAVRLPLPHPQHPDARLGRRRRTSSTPATVPGGASRRASRCAPFSTEGWSAPGRVVASPGDRNRSWRRWRRRCAAACRSAAGRPVGRVAPRPGHRGRPPAANERLAAGGRRRASARGRVRRRTADPGLAVRGARLRRGLPALLVDPSSTGTRRSPRCCPGGPTSSASRPRPPGVGDAM